MNGLSIPVIGLVIAVFVLVLLVLRTRVHPLIAMIAAASIAGITGGMSLSETLDSVTRGFGATLASIGIVIGLGVMMGRILEVSGAAEQIAHSFVRWLGHRRETWAMALTGYFVSIPIFVDSAFVILFPIVKALSKTSGRPVLSLGVALAGGLVVTHTLVPPTPGPLAAAGIFGVDIGAMMLLGIALAIPCAVSVVLYAHWLGNRYPAIPVPDELPGKLTAAADVLNPQRPLPPVALAWLPIAVPIFLIFLNACARLVPALSTNSGTVANALTALLGFFGAPIIALSVGTLIAVYTLIPTLDRKQSNARLEEGLQSAGIILLVTGAGGALGAVVRDSGAGTALAEQIRNLPLSPVMIPFFVATAVRLIQGSGTVACITSASITAPVLAQIPGVSMLIAAQSAVMGALCFSYFNDSLFWVVNRMMGVVDVKQQILVWSVPTTLAWAVGGITVPMVNGLFGTGGKWVDPVLPLIVLFALLIACAKNRRD